MFFEGDTMKILQKIFIFYIIILSILLLIKFNFSMHYILEKINSINLSREQGAWNINLVPFRTISSQLHLLKILPSIAVKNLIGNIVIFAPFGFLFPMGYKNMRKCHRTFMAGLIYILMIEFIQFVCMLGAFDVDDIILNSIGVICGFAVFEIARKKWEYRK